MAVLQPLWKVIKFFLWFIVSIVKLFFLLFKLPFKVLSLVDKKPGSALKLEAQKVTAFAGSINEWQRWKHRTECAFDGSGYEKILNSREFSERNPDMNRIVYSQLATATSDGNAYSLVFRHHKKRDGFSAWQSLCDRYDGDSRRNEHADEIREKLQALRMSTGMTADTYINRFELWVQELSEIPGEGFTDNHALQLFLRNIQDPDYATEVKILRRSSQTLHQAIDGLRQQEREVVANRRAKRTIGNRPRRQQLHEDAGYEFYNPEQPPQKRRRLLEPNQTSNLISVPPSEWRSPEFPESARTFVQNWNSKVKNHEDPTTLAPPDGITVRLTKKARRNETTTMMVNPVTPPLPPAPEGKLPPTGESPYGKKRISFHMEDDNVEAVD